MIRVSAPGSFDKTISFLRYIQSGKMYRDLDKYGRQGVDALSHATPIDTGLASQSWEYDIAIYRTGCVLSWSNTDVEDGVNIAVIIQYGHGTGTGGYVVGIDYINPAIRPVFDRIVEDIWRQVTNA